LSKYKAFGHYAMTGIDGIFIPPSMHAALAACLALLIERFIPISSSVNPLTVFRFICQRMANKVLHTRYEANQAILSGCLGLLVLVLPTIIISYLVYSFASYQWLLDVLLLWILLQFSQQLRAFKQTAAALKQDKKVLAKSYLQKLMLRDTAPLSAVGITKACIEGIYLRYTYQQITVLFCYFLGGPILALLYRLCYEANHAWNPKLPAFVAFGKCAQLITSLFQYFPAVICSITFMLSSQPAYMAKALVSANYWRAYGHNLQSVLLFSLAQAMRLKTGGPVIYEQRKVRRVRHVGTFTSSNAKLNEPSIASIEVITSLINRHIIVSMAIICGIAFSIGHLNSI